MEKIPFSVYDSFSYLAAGFLLLIATDYAFNGGYFSMENMPTAQVLFWTVVVYIVGHLISHLSSVLLENLFLRRVLGSPEIHLFSNKKKSYWSRIFRENFASFPMEIQKRILTRAEKENLSVPSRGFFFHCHSLVKCDQTTRDRLNSFLALYGFCRNISMSLLIAAALLFIGALIDSKWAFGGALSSKKALISFIAFMCSVGMFFRYLKFFRHYTTEVFLSYAVLSERKE